MSAIDTAMLTAMRESIATLLPDTAQVITITHTPDGMGGQTDTRATSSAFAFRLDVMQTTEQIEGGALQPYTSYKGSMPYDTSIEAANELLHTGVPYTIKPSNVNQSWIAVKRVDLEKK